MPRDVVRRYRSPALPHRSNLTVGALPKQGHREVASGDSDQEEGEEEEEDEDAKDEDEEAGQSAWVQVESKNFHPGDLYWYSPLRP